MSTASIAPFDGIGLVSPELALVDPVLRKTLQTLETLQTLALARPPADRSPQHVVGAAERGLGLSPSEQSPGPSQPRTIHISTGRVRLGLIGLASVIAFVLGAKFAGPADLTPGQAMQAALSAQLSPPSDLRGTVDRGVQRLAWAPVAGATGYKVEIFNNGASVFTAHTSVPSINLSAAVRQALPHGSLAWYVWPTGPNVRDDSAVVRSQIALTP